MVSACVRRKQIAYVRQRGISLRRACALLQVARSTVGYESALAKRDAPVIEAMRELAAQYPRFGYRRIQVFLARRGLTMSADRNYLNYSVLAHDPVQGQHLGILLIEFGVGLTVASAMITIFFIFAGRDRDAEED